MASQQNQLREGADLGDLAYINTDDLNAAVNVVRSLEQLKGANGLTSEVVTLTDGSVRGVFFYDSTDTATANDDRDTIVTLDGRRYKRRFLLRKYTPATTSDTGMTTNEACFDDNFLYIKTGASIIKKIALTAF